MSADPIIASDETDSLDWIPADMVESDFDSSDAKRVLRVNRLRFEYQQRNPGSHRSECDDAIRTHLRARRMRFGLASHEELQAAQRGEDLTAEAMQRIENSVEEYKRGLGHADATFADAIDALVAKEEERRDAQKRAEQNQKHVDDANAAVLKMVMADPLGRVLVEAYAAALSAVHVGIDTDHAGLKVLRNQMATAIGTALTRQMEIMRELDRSMGKMALGDFPRTFVRLAKLEGRQVGHQTFFASVYEPAAAKGLLKKLF